MNGRPPGGTLGIRLAVRGAAVVLRLVVLVALVGGGAPLLTRAQAALDAGPLEVGGDPISILVPGRIGGPAIFAVGARGLYRTENGGATWTIAGPPPPGGRLVVAEDDARQLLVGDHPPCARGGDGAPLQRSADGGATWQPATDGEDTRPLALWTGAGVALGVACDGPRVSTDGGVSWSPAGVDLGGLDVTSFAAVATAGPPPTPAAGTPAAPIGFIVATSEGGTSRLHRLDLTDSSVPTLSGVLLEFWGLGAVAARGDVVAIGAADGVRISRDGGATWDLRRRGLEAVTLAESPLVAGVLLDTPPGSFGIDALMLDPGENGRLYAGTADGVYASPDTGDTWRRLDGADGPVVNLAFGIETDVLFVETAAGVVVVPIGEVGA